jgi:hypothetical protein
MPVNLVVAALTLPVIGSIVRDRLIFGFPQLRELLSVDNPFPFQRILGVFATITAGSSV